MKYRLSRFFSGMLCAVLLVSAPLLSSCQKKDVVLDVTAVADALKAQMPFVDTLDAATDSGVERTYTALNAEDVKAKVVYTGSGATAEEIAVFEAVDKDAAARVKAAVDKHIEETRESFTDYNPEELNKLKDPVVVTEGVYVILCVSDDNAKAKSCVDGFLK